MLGSLKGQDVGKALAMAVIIIGVISITIGEAYQIEFFNNLTASLKSFFSVNK